MRSIGIYHLDGPGKFEYEVISRPVISASGEPAEWHICIRGERPTALTEVTDAELVEYANCRGEVEAVRRYIDRYGPPYLVEPTDEDVLYADLLPRWRGLQLQFRERWDRILGIEIKNAFTETFGKQFPELWKAQEPWKRVQVNGGEFRLVGGELIFVAKTHDAALGTKLLAISAAGKLRKCLNPECTNTPYFIAEHGKVQYCSEECGHWGQRQAKLRYWHEKKKGGKDRGRPRGAGQSKSRRRKNVTRKTR